MYANSNRFDDRLGAYNTFDEWEDGRGTTPGHRMPPGHGMSPGHGMPPRHGAPRGFGPGRPGFPPHGMPPFGGPGGPGGPGDMPPFGGRPPRRPDPDFLRRRIGDSDLAELLVMAGRMLHRRPQGGPMQGQALILSILAGREALSQRELQMMLGIQPGSLSELVSKLEAKGYLTREKAEDRRGNLLRLTDAGRAAIPGIDDAPEDDPFAPLTAEQQDALANMLRTLLTHWVDQLASCPVGPGGQRPVQV